MLIALAMCQGEFDNLFQVVLEISEPSLRHIRHMMWRTDGRSELLPGHFRLRGADPKLDVRWLFIGFNSRTDQSNARCLQC